MTRCTTAIDALADSLGGDEASTVRDVDFESVTVTGDEARARPKNATATADLVKVDGTWYISGGLGF